MKFSFYHFPDNTDTANPADATKYAWTDNAKLVGTDTIYISPDGDTTDEAFPKPKVDMIFV